MQPDRPVRRADSVMATDVGDDGVVMMDVDLAAYFGLNGSAARVWRLLEEPRTLDELVARLVEEYAVEPERCRGEVTEVLDELLERELVRYVD